jgi:hypothetical protein
MKSLVVIAGDCGVYAGYAEGGARALGADGRIELHDARHLRRYYVLGRVGDGSAGDLAALGIDPTSPSVSRPVAGVTVLVGARRAFECSPGSAASFEALP